MGNWSSKKPEPAAATQFSTTTSPVHKGNANNATIQPSPVIYYPRRNSGSNVLSSPTKVSPSHVSASSSQRSAYNSSSTSASSSQSSGISTSTYPSTASSSLSSQRTATTSPNISKIRPAVVAPVVGNQIVKHTVNNYIIPKVQEVRNVQGTCINVPYRKSVDKFALRVCPQYNSRSGCHAAICRRFHVCYYWVQNKCQKTSCDYDHSYGSEHNRIIYIALASIKYFNEISLSESLRNNHRYNRKTKREGTSHLCMFSIMKKCNKESCSLIHANKPYRWEMEDGDDWVQLAYEQSDTLEQHFSQPDQEIVALPPVGNMRALQKLRSLMKSGQWQANFLNMNVYCGSDSRRLRRLSTPSDICCMNNMNRLATRWVWYWRDDSGLWKPYTDGCGKFHLVGLSDELEYHYNFADKEEFEITIDSHSYEINVRDMTQLNLQTRKVRNVRRRPSCVEKEKKNVEISFDQFFFQPAISDKKRQSVLTASPEFAFVRGLLEASMIGVNLMSVERVVNHHHWKAYQNKKNLLGNLYRGTNYSINEQYLFHGTKHSVIDQICNENFDWRLFGTNVGNVFGHGVYFSNLASFADSYCETSNSGIKAMFIVLVLVGTMAIGNSTMKLPPKNEETKRCFDTTCNDRNDSKIFVKYNRDEYYPVYIAFYQG